MDTDLTTDLDYNPVLDALIEKTTARKLAWSETANAHSYMVVVGTDKGEQTFIVERAGELARVGSATPILRDSGSEMRLLLSQPTHRLKVSDADGKELFTVGGSSSGPVGQLYKIAERVAKQIDEKIDNTVELLSTL